MFALWKNRLRTSIARFYRCDGWGGYCLKLSFFIGCLRRGGAERVISILANAYAEQGHDVDVVLLLSEEIAYDLHPAVRIVSLCETDGSYVRRMPTWLHRIRQYLRKRQPDRVISFIARINLLVLAASLGLRQTVIVSERNDPKRDGRGVMIRMGTQLLYPHAQAIVFQTEYAKHCFSKRIQKRGVVIPNPITVDAPPSVHAAQTIVTAGRLMPQKNQKMLLEAFAGLHRAYPDYRLILYGDGSLKEALLEQARRLGLEQFVSLPGNVKDIHAKLAGAALFVLTSDYEGQSNALLEAMMLGLPCITTDWDGVDEVIQTNDNGIIVPRGDTAALQQAMEQVLGDEKLRDQLAEKAKTSARNYGQSAVMKRWAACINGDR